MTEPAKPPSPPSDTGPLPTDEEAIRAAVAALAARLAPDGPPKESGVTLAPVEVPPASAAAAATAAAMLSPVTVVPGRAAPPPEPVEPPKPVEIVAASPLPAPRLELAEAPDRPVKLRAAPRRGPGRLVAALLLLVLLLGGGIWLLRDHPQVAALLDGARTPASEPKQASAPAKPTGPPTAPAPAKPDGLPPAPTAATPPAPPATAPAPPATDPAPPAAGPTAADPPKAAVPPAETPPAKPDIAASPPTFDNVLVRDGRAVISGRAPPGAQVEVKLDDRTVATVEADARGEWVVILDAPLPPGGHEFRLVQTPRGGTPVPSDRTVAVLVPPPAAPPPLAAAPPVAPAAPPSTDAAKPDTSAPSASAPAPAPPPPAAAPLVVATPTAPGGASQVLQSPPLARAGDLVLGTVDYDDTGRLTIAGQANPGETVRVYLNNEPVGDATAGADGKWTLAPGRATPHGPQRLRVDRLTAGGPGVAHRLEVPFERVTVKPGNAVTIVRGDNLWNIARGALGSGERFTVIYEANRNQIRDPNLIYPGQVFVIPKPR